MKKGKYFFKEKSPSVLVIKFLFKVDLSGNKFLLGGEIRRIWSQNKLNII